ncbi:MAG: transcriptional regulator, partial [bacterium]|nr:transcriptional regulator [bacterium]
MPQEGLKTEENRSDCDIVYEFGSYLMDVGQRVLTRDGVEIHLAPKTFDLLLFLVERSNRIVKKEEVFESVWNNSFVEDANLVVHISTLRKMFSAHPDAGVSIETFPKTGYRLNAEVRELPRRDGVPISEATLIGDPSAAGDVSRPAERNDRFAWLAVGLVGFVLLAAFAFGFPSLFQRKTADAVVTVPSYKQLTFERGTIWAARYGPNGSQVVYGAKLNGGPLDLYMLSSPSTESQALSLRDTSLLSVSSKGDMAVLQNQHYLYQFIHRGTLARMSIGSR